MSAAGGGRLGCVVMAAILVLFGIASYNVIPVYLDKIEFNDDIERIVRRAGVDQWDNRFLSRQIIEAAGIRGFELTEEDIRIRRTSPFTATPRITVQVDFRKRVRFPGYVYTFRFSSEVTSIVGRL